MFWRLLHNSMAGEPFRSPAVQKASVIGWTDKQIRYVLILATILNIIIPVTIAFIIYYFTHQ